MIKHCPTFAERLARRFLEPGDSVLDLGAADGEYSVIYAQRVGSTGDVLAVEPDAKNLVALRQAVRDLPWVTVLPAAVGATAGVATLYSSRRYPKTASLYAGNVRKGATSQVPVTTIDSLVLTMKQSPSLIQIDVQGAEAAILAGAKRTLALPCVWVIEVWPKGLAQAGASVEQVLAPFQRQGFVAESPSGLSLTWSGVEREVQRVGPAPHGHFDLVLVPEQLQVAAVSA